MKKRKKLKLFVWTDHDSDYTSGLAFAVARDEAHARKLVVKENGDRQPISWGYLEIHPLTKSIAFRVCGGG